MNTWNTRLNSKALAAVLTAALTACGGGGAVPQTQTLAKPSAVAVRAVIQFPAGSSSASATRSPKYISPATNGATISVYPAGNDVTPVFQQSDDLAAGSPLCTSTSPRSCTIPMEVSPGTYDFVLAMYDTAPVSGVSPSGAKELSTVKVTQTINPAGLNTVDFALQGIPVGAPTLTCGGTSCGTLTYWSLPANGSVQSFPIAVTAYDADGHAITGSNPYATPISVTLTESGGSGHTVLTVNGAAVGTTATLTSPVDTLALQYDGGGAPGYTTTTTIGGTSVVMSPMYVVPDAAISEVNLSDSHSASVTEANAPVGEAYSASAACPDVTPSTSGSGASASLTMVSHAPGGTSLACNVTVKDSLANATVTIPFNFVVPGPITAGTPTFASGGSGTCASGLAFTGSGQTAVMALADPGYSGTISSSSGAAGTAAVSVSGTTATVTAGATAGTTTVTFSDTSGNVLTCSIGLTITSGSAS